MKLGTENRRAVVVAGVLAIVAVFTVARWLTAPEPEVASKATASAGTTKGGRAGRPAPPTLMATLDPTLRLDQLRASEDVKYEGKGRNIFRAGSEPAPTIAKVEPTKDTTPAGPQQPPPPPPINLKFYGFASKPGEPKQVFLSQGEDVFIAAEGDIVNRRYKVVRIGATSVEVEDLQYNHRQTLPLTQS
ncbi:MAG: hypothetical protein L0099_04810 [Acidobacteria bacterium]|nr:hypothetical protein [Acidobacteriota bacterium]